MRRLPVLPSQVATSLEPPGASACPPMRPLKRNSLVPGFPCNLKLPVNATQRVQRLAAEFEEVCR